MTMVGPAFSSDVKPVGALGFEAGSSVQERDSGQLTEGEVGHTTSAPIMGLSKKLVNTSLELAALA